MKKAVQACATGGAVHSIFDKSSRENIWCAKFGYFIDLEACRARSYQKSVCRRCYASLLQLSLPFDEVS